MAKMKSLLIADQTQVRLDIANKKNELESAVNEEGVREARDQFIENL